jgi:hypothetical protein
VKTIASIEVGILLSLIPLHEEAPRSQMAFFIQAVLLAQELVKG